MASLGSHLLKVGFYGARWKKFVTECEMLRYVLVTHLLIAVLEVQVQVRELAKLRLLALASSWPLVVSVLFASSLSSKEPSHEPEERRDWGLSSARPEAKVPWEVAVAMKGPGVVDPSNHG
jgi:hypothetical protein